MKIVSKKISTKELEKIADETFGNLVKAVVDVVKEIMAIGASLHADEEAELIKRGSSQADLWGINLYPQQKTFEEMIKFDSVVNLRPTQGNLSRNVEDSKIRQRIVQIVKKLVIKK